MGRGVVLREGGRERVSEGVGGGSGCGVREDMIQLVSDLCSLGLCCVQSLPLLHHLSLHLQPRSPSVIVASRQSALTTHLVTWTHERESEKTETQSKFPTVSAKESL